MRSMKEQYDQVNEVVKPALIQNGLMKQTGDNLFHVA